MSISKASAIKPLGSDAQGQRAIVREKNRRAKDLGRGPLQAAARSGARSLSEIGLGHGALKKREVSLEHAGQRRVRSPQRPPSAAARLSATWLAEGRAQGEQRAGWILAEKLC